MAKRGEKPAGPAEEKDSLLALADRLHSAAIHLLRKVRYVDAETGLSPPLLSALSVIVFAGPLTLKDLAAAEQIRPPTAARIVEQLVSTGYVARKRAVKDKRAVSLQATAKGRDALERGRRRRLRILEQLIRQRSETDQRNLRRGVDVLEKLLPPRPGPGSAPSTRRRTTDSG